MANSLASYLSMYYFDPSLGNPAHVFHSPLD
jgi:hypothetical protein